MATKWLTNASQYDETLIGTPGEKDDAMNDLDATLAALSIPVLAIGQAGRIVE